VLAPMDIITILEVVASVGSAGFLAVLSGKHGHLGLDHKVVELKSLNKVSVPDLATIRNTDVLHILRDLVEYFTALLEVVLATENSGVPLHCLLHLSAHGSRGDLSGGVTHLV
jgi:hypothetical protein